MTRESLKCFHLHVALNDAYFSLFRSLFATVWSVGMPGQVEPPPCQGRMPNTHCGTCKYIGDGNRVFFLGQSVPACSRPSNRSGAIYCFFKTFFTWLFCFYFTLISVNIFFVNLKQLFCKAFDRNISSICCFTRARRRCLQSPMDNERIHTNIPFLEGIPASSVRAAERPAYICYCTLVLNHCW